MTTLLAPLGEAYDAVYPVVDELEPDEILLFTTPHGPEPSVLNVGIPCHSQELTGDFWEAMFRRVAELENDDSVMLVSSGDKYLSCIATSAAFVNGLKAVGVRDGEVRMLPVMQFDYTKELTDRKTELLTVIYKDECCGTMEELAERTGLSKPLISYHVNGNLKSDGLEDLGLVETVDHGSGKSVKLTTQGRLLVQGYV